MNVQSFSPIETKTISATTTSSSQTFSATGAAATQVRVYNAGSVTAFIRWSLTSATAVTTDMPIAPGTIELFNKGLNDTVAAITAAGAATLYVTAGEGC